MDCPNGSNLQSDTLIDMMSTQNRFKVIAGNTRHLLNCLEAQGHKISHINKVVTIKSHSQGFNKIFHEPKRKIIAEFET